MTRAAARPTRDGLLEAAVRVVGRDGVARLTLEAVAKEAGVSKGGLLYHFSSKDALVEGLIGRALDLENERLEAEAAADPGPGGWARTYARLSAAPDADDPLGSLDAVGNGLLAAVGTNPALLEPVRERFRAWQARLEKDGLDPAQATLVRLAADGLWLADLFGLAPPQGKLREAVLEAMLELAKEDRR